MNTLHDNRKDYQYCKEATMTRWEAERMLEEYKYNPEEARKTYEYAKKMGWIVDARRRVPGNQWSEKENFKCGQMTNGTS